MRESHARSIVKAFTWRIIASLTTMALVLIFTGNLTLMVGVGTFDILTKLIFYYIHERAWNGVSWGKFGKKKI